jgi:hypothetical protein
MQDGEAREDEDRTKDDKRACKAAREVERAAERGRDERAEGAQCEEDSLCVCALLLGHRREDGRAGGNVARGVGKGLDSERERGAHDERARIAYAAESGERKATRGVDECAA